MKLITVHELINNLIKLDRNQEIGIGDSEYEWLPINKIISEVYYKVYDKNHQKRTGLEYFWIPEDLIDKSDPKNSIKNKYPNSYKIERVDLYIIKS